MTFLFLFPISYFYFLFLSVSYFARSTTDIKDKTIDIINHARKSLLFYDGNAWVKKEGNPLFDVTMGSYDKAEVCELIGLYSLNKLAPLIGTKNVGFYRDDG